MEILEERLMVVSGMKKYGGSFVKGLGQALLCADHINTKKIKKTWPELWEKYLKMEE